MKSEKYIVPYHVKTIREATHKGLPSFLDQVLIGICLGDGHLVKSSPNSNIRFTITFAEKYKPLALYIYGLFIYYINPKGFIFKKVNSGVNSKFFGRIELRSVNLPIFNYYHDLFYKNVEGRYIKIIPLNIEELLSPVALAFLICGDGNFHKTNKIIRLCTNSYTKEEVVLLSQAIFNKFNIPSRIEKVRNDQFLIVIRNKHIHLLQDLVKEHIHPSMLYRIGLDSLNTI